MQQRNGNVDMLSEDLSKDVCITSEAIVKDLAYVYGIDYKKLTSECLSIKSKSNIFNYNDDSVHHEDNRNDMVQTIYKRLKELKYNRLIKALEDELLSVLVGDDLLEREVAKEICDQRGKNRDRTI